jgi:hypothetical protein
MITGEQVKAARKLLDWSQMALAREGSFVEFKATANSDYQHQTLPEHRNEKAFRCDGFQIGTW